MNLQYEQREARGIVAEREGFEPPNGCPLPDFESGAFDHSAISPELRIIAEHATARASRAPRRCACAFLAWFVLASALALAGCATIPGADYPRIESTALAHPEETALGASVAARVRAHNQLSAFHLIPSGNDGLILRAELADAAQRSLDVQYYVFQNDDSGQLLLDAILHAARRGVRVRMLIDDSAANGAEARIAAFAAHPNIEVRMFNPFRYRGSIEALRITEFLFGMSRLDYRMHNKLMIADGSIAMAGGRNVGDEYFGAGKSFSFGDYDVFAMGPIVRDCSRSFDEYWNSDLAIPVQALYPGAPTGDQLKAFERELAEHKYDTGFEDVVKSVSGGAPLDRYLVSDEGLAWARAEVIWDSPYKKWVDHGDEPGQLLRRRLLQEMHGVKRELTIVSPYFVPGQRGEDMLEDLVRRGVRVRVLTNSLESTDVPAVHVGYRKYRKELLEDGIELYEVRPVLGQPHEQDGVIKAPSSGQFALHAKVYEFDGQRIFVGSANFDPRSFHLNTEIGLIIDSPELAKQVIERFNAIASPENSYVVALDDGKVVWRTEQDGRMVEHHTEPAQDRLKQAEVDLLSLLPIESQL